jgi:hypothetical protein
MALIPKAPKGTPDKGTENKEPEPASVADAALTPNEFAAGGKPEEKPPVPPAKPAKPVGAPQSDQPVLWRVVEDTKVMLGVVRTTFARGQVLSRNHYLPKVWAVIKQVVKLEPVKE